MHICSTIYLNIPALFGSGTDPTFFNNLDLSRPGLEPWRPFHRMAYACRNSTTVVNIVLSQVLDKMSVSLKGVLKNLHVRLVKSSRNFGRKY